MARHALNVCDQASPAFDRVCLSESCAELLHEALYSIHTLVRLCSNDGHPWTPHTTTLQPLYMCAAGSTIVQRLQQALVNQSVVICYMSHGVATKVQKAPHSSTRNQIALGPLHQPCTQHHVGAPVRHTTPTSQHSRTVTNTGTTASAAPRHPCIPVTSQTPGLLGDFTAQTSK